jgi:hypothetical protein
MNGTKDPAPASAKIPRARYFLMLDVIMLILVCVLEALSLTGLAWHEWLGFALCVLVLLHVVLQWRWFITEFRRLFIRGAYRTRANSVLNYLLFIGMVAVLVSGVIISNQVAPFVGNSLGRPRVWSELHGWLNFTLVVLVALHLALNWDWVLGAVRGRTVALARLPAFPTLIWRGAIVLLATCVVAAAAYATMSAMMKPNRRAERAATQTAGTNRTPKPREGRQQSFRGGMTELDIAVLVVVFFVVFGRYVLRIHL